MQCNAGRKTNFKSTCLCGSSLAFFFPFEFTLPSCLPETSNHRSFYLWVFFSLNSPTGFSYRLNSHLRVISTISFWLWGGIPMIVMAYVSLTFSCSINQFHCQIWWRFLPASAYSTDLSSHTPDISFNCVIEIRMGLLSPFFLSLTWSQLSSYLNKEIKKENKTTNQRKKSKKTL